MKDFGQKCESSPKEPEGRLAGLGLGVNSGITKHGNRIAVA